MQILQCGTTPNSKLDSDSKDRIVREPSKQDRIINLIKIANSKFKLFDILSLYKINVIQQSATDVWSALIKCPFSSHKGGQERTPSFGYNFKEDRFHCFGCSTSGRAVEFIAIKENKPKQFIAEQLLQDIDSLDLEEELEEDVNLLIESKLYELSKLFQQTVQRYKYSSVFGQIEKIIWCFDMYLVRNYKNLTVESLEWWIQRTKESLEDLGIFISSAK